MTTQGAARVRPFHGKVRQGRGTTPQHTVGVDNINPTQGGTSAEYLLRRLRRAPPPASHIAERIPPRRRVELRRAHDPLSEVGDFDL